LSVEAGEAEEAIESSGCVELFVVVDERKTGIY